MANKNLRVIQHNVLSWTYNRRNELCNTYRIEDPDIILINSHGRKNTDRIKIFNYDIYQNNHTDEANDGAAIAVKKTIKHKIIDDLEESFLAIIVQTTMGEICIGTGYQPPRRPTIPIHNINRILRRNSPAFFLGDINARHRILGHSNNNTTGTIINDLIGTGNIMHVGPDFQTYITPIHAGIPDIILTNNNQIHNIYSHPGPITTSDHLPIIFEISSSPIQIPIEPKYNFNEADWEKFKTDLQQNPQINIDGQLAAQIETEINNWFTKVIKAMDSNIPKTTHKTIPSPKMTAEIKWIWNQYKQLLNNININSWNNIERIRLKALQINLQTKCIEERKRLWEKLILKTECKYQDPEKFWQNIQQLMGTNSSKITYILNNQGVRLYTDKEQEKEFRNHFTKIFQISDEDNQDFDNETERMVNEFLQQNEDRYKSFPVINLSRLDPENPVIKPITVQKVINTINSFKNKKAPGNSKINKMILQKIPKNMLKNLTHIYNAALSAGIFPDKFKEALLKLIPKAGKTNTLVLNYRPISLLEVVGKVFEKIINNRLRNYLEDNNMNNPRQQSFRRHRGTATAIALIYEKIANSQQNRYQCNVICRDISKCFDKIWHSGLKFKIIQLNLPRCMTSLLCNFLDNRRARIKINNYIGEPINLYSGVPQGSCISPTLFNIYVADIPPPTQSEFIQYADDITQIITYEGKSKEYMKRKTERAIAEINDYEYKWKIKTNQNKFKILHISKKKPLPITINGQNIPYSGQETILGLKISTNGITSHIKNKKQKATAALQKIKRFGSLNTNIKLHLYKALVLPHLEYPPIPLNTIKQTNKYKLQAVQNKALRWVMSDRPPYSTNTEEIHLSLQVDSLNIRNFNQAYKTWEKLRIFQEEEVEKITDVEILGTHSWWPKSYLEDNAISPPPIYCRSRARREDEDYQ